MGRKRGSGREVRQSQIGDGVKSVAKGKVSAGRLNTGHGKKGFELTVVVRLSDSETSTEGLTRKEGRPRDNA